MVKQLRIKEASSAQYKKNRQYLQRYQRIYQENSNELSTLKKMVQNLEAKRNDLEGKIVQIPEKEDEDLVKELDVLRKEN